MSSRAPASDAIARVRDERSTLRLAVAVGAAAALLAGAAVASDRADARVQVGVYQDNPVKQLGATRSGPGRKIRIVSTYVTTGRPLSSELVGYANSRGLRLMITWMPDNGTSKRVQPKYRLSRIAAGGQDANLMKLGRQARRLKLAPIIRPMPEMNTPWYPWSGTVNRNNGKKYKAAWKRVRAKVKAGAGSRGRKIKFLWAPYVRSFPDRPTNQFASYFPGRGAVDYVGVSGYNFGTTKRLVWANPEDLFAVAYRDITALAAKPFWIAETGSTSRGGNKALWMSRLGKLQSKMPRLTGIVWYDVKEKSGDFRIAQNKRTVRTWRAFLKARAR
jgi:beta-mannanase